MSLRKCEDSSEPLLFAYTRMDVDEDSVQELPDLGLLYLQKR